MLTRLVDAMVNLLEVSSQQYGALLSIQSLKLTDLLFGIRSYLDLRPASLCKKLIELVHERLVQKIPRYG